MTRLKMLAGLATGALLALATPAAAERTQFNAKDVVVPQDGKAYIYYRTTNKQFATFLRTVTPDEQAEWARKRTEAFEKAKAKYVKKLDSWNKLVAAKYPDPGPKPVEPTDETFAFPAPELDHFVSANFGRVMIDAKPHYAYLLMVEPGEYTYYGPAIVGAQGASGICMCMGSLRFTAAAGQIVDLGEIDNVAVEGADPKDKTALAAHMAIDPKPAWNALPANLPKLPVVQADYHAANKIANFMGITIDRLLPLSGVLDYQRDKVIDVTTGAPAG